MKNFFSVILALLLLSFGFISCDYFNNPADPTEEIYESREIEIDTPYSVEPVFYFGFWGVVKYNYLPVQYFTNKEIIMTVILEDESSVQQSVFTDENGYYEIAFYDIVDHSKLKIEIKVNDDGFYPMIGLFSYENGELIGSDPMNGNWLNIIFVKR
ncbi:MAG: hypothetical protein PHV06_03480 [bacterium]|nr:hypothetical protein [bacterium]